MSTHVLHVLRDLSCNGGVQRLVYDMALAAPSFGHAAEVMIYHREPGPEYVDALRQAGVPVHVVSSWNWVHQKLLLDRADVVHAHLFPALYVVGLLRPGSIYTEHNTTNNRRRLRYLQPVERWMYGRFHRVTCISPEVRDALLAFLGPGARDNTRVVYNGVNVDRLLADVQIRRTGAEAPLPEGFRVAMLGSLTAKKDQATLIKALSLLPTDVSLFLAGQGPQETMLRELAQSLGVADRVHFSGIVTDVSSFLAPMHAYVQSSQWEGFGLAAIEAMACGLPVLCANVPGLNNLAQDTVNLFERGDAQGLAQSLLRLQRDQNFRQRLLALGHATAQRFSLDRMLRQFHDIYLREQTHS